MKRFHCFYGIYLSWVMTRIHVSITQSNGTSACPTGHYRDSSQGCKLCSKCRPGTEAVFQSCVNQSGTVCRSCDPGTFSSGGLKCQNCSDCPPGTFVASVCRPTKDTECEPCEDDRYSSDWSSRSCEQCSRCNRHKTVLKNCSKTENYKCGDCILGYFKHPNLPTCIKCSYCYPENPGVTVVVPECLSKSNDPTMTCMPIVGGPQLVGFAGSGSLRNTGASSTARTSSTTLSHPSAIPVNNVHSSDVLIPPNISIPIIISSVTLITFFAIIMIILKRKKNSRLAGIFCKVCYSRKESTFKVNFTSDRKPERGRGDPNAEVQLVDGDTALPGVDGSDNPYIAETDVPIFSCNECLLHYGLETGVGPNHTSSADILSDGRRLSVLDTDEGFQDHDNNDSIEFLDREPQRLDSTGIDESFMFIIGRDDSDDGTVDMKVHSGGCVRQCASLCAENDAFVDGEECVSPDTSLHPKEIQIQHRRPKVGSFHANSNHQGMFEGGGKVIFTSVAFRESSPDERTCQTKDVSASKEKSLTVLNVQRLDSGIAECGVEIDTEDSDVSEDSFSPKSAMFSDYDSDAVVGTILLDSGQVPTNRSVARGGQTKTEGKKSR